MTAGRQVEAELAGLEEEDRALFLEELGVAPGTTGLEVLVKEAYDLLGLQVYFTSGPKETRAWQIKKGTTAPQVSYPRPSIPSPRLRTFSPSLLA